MKTLAKELETSLGKNDLEFCINLLGDITRMMANDNTEMGYDSLPLFNSILLSVIIERIKELKKINKSTPEETPASNLNEGINVEPLKN